MAALRTFHKSVPSMTSHLDVTIVLPEDQAQRADALMAMAYAEAERLIGIISAWQPGTELYRVNEQAGKAAVKVCDELFYLLKRSIRISEWTNGLFDVTFASIDKVWFFDRPMLQLPTEAAIKASVRHIDYRHIILNEAEKTVFIRNAGTKIELGAIGKGFIANKMKAVLQKNGIENGMVNAGGDLTAWGSNERGEDWKIAITDPNRKSGYIAWVPVKNGGIATSGSYERFALIDGKKYAHILHPKTGYPVSGLKSVTVISPDAELCDAIATSVFLLGKEAGLAFVDRYKELQCFVVDDGDNYYYSENLKETKYAIRK